MSNVGIDLHPDHMVNVVLNSNGKEIRREKRLPSKQALESFFGSFEELARAVVECTSNWYWLSDWFRSHDIPLTLAHAKMVKAISYAKVKTDKGDAKTLAELLRADLIPEARQIEADRRDLRELTRGCLRMGGHRREGLQSSVWNLAAKYNVHIEEMGWQYPKQLMEWLEDQLPEVAVESQLVIDQILQLQPHIGQMEHAIEDPGDFTPELELIQLVPGVDLVTGGTMLAEMGDIPGSPPTSSFPVTAGWFRAVRIVADPTGTRPAIKRPTNTCDWPSDNPPSALTRGMARSRNFTIKYKRRSGKKIARTVVAKELSKIIWHGLTTNQPYNGFKGPSTRGPLNLAGPSP